LINYQKNKKLWDVYNLLQDVSSASSLFLLKYVYSCFPDQKEEPTLESGLGTTVPETLNFREAPLAGYGDHVNEKRGCGGKWNNIRSGLEGHCFGL